MRKYLVVFTTLLGLILPFIAYSQYNPGRRYPAANAYNPRSVLVPRAMPGSNVQILEQGDIILSERDNSWCEVKTAIRQATRYEGFLKIIMAPFSIDQSQEPPFPDEERSTFYSNDIYYMSIPVTLNITSDFSVKGSDLIKGSGEAGIKLAMKIGNLKKEKVRSDGTATIEPLGNDRYGNVVFKVDTLQFNLPENLLMALISNGAYYWSEPSSLNNTTNYDAVSSFIKENFDSIESVVKSINASDSGQSDGSVDFLLDKSLILDTGAIKLVSRQYSTCADDKGGFHLCMQFSLQRIRPVKYMAGSNPES